MPQICRRLFGLCLCLMLWTVTPAMEEAQSHEQLIPILSVTSDTPSQGSVTDIVVAVKQRADRRGLTV
ncbi:hypothetical protein [Nitrospira sp. KM1]|uniref:hypothetical protein n=1 Tax=Nitrospira sp. KM1 TaxID=1936990 RepID=UPI0015665624|nr:hypothetical protein [Nitrospira sp. KM1]